jgi:hypothetical protein
VPQRTTLTLDDDVAAKLKREARRSGLPYRSVVNQALRRGLEAGPMPVSPYRVKARPMGRRRGLEVDHVAGLSDLLDGPHGR